MSGDNFPSANALPLGLGACAGVVAALHQSGAFASILTQAPSDRKPFATFSDFYPHYLKEHSLQTTKRLHYVGTSIFLLLLVLNPKLILPILSAAAVGYALFPFLRHLSSGLPEMLTMFGVYIACGYLATGNIVSVLSPMVIAYAFAWVGHFVFEKNKPATFIYPTFSLFGDFRMLFEALTGKVPL